MDYIAVHLTITPFSEETSEIVIAEIADLGYDSFTEDNDTLNAFIPKDNFNEQNLRTVLCSIQLPDTSLSYTLELIREQNWNAVWESDFEPVVIRDVLTIKARHHKDCPRTRYNIIINPGMSFGSGHHQTTCLMIESLLDLGRSLRGCSVLDMGCGTGILSIAAAKLGAASPVHAVDIDPVCVRSAIANAKSNRVGHKIITLCGDASVLQVSRYDIILANINRNILLDDLSTYARALHRGGSIFMSGFYTEDIPMLEKKAAQYHLELSDRRDRDNWACIRFVRTI